MNKINIPKQELKQLYQEEKMKISEIAEIYNVSTQPIRNRMKEYNMPRRNPNYYRKTRIKKSKLMSLYYKEEKSTYEIAEEFDVSQSTIINKMNEYNMPRRLSNSLKINITEKELRKHYWKENKTLKEIGEIYNVSPECIRKKMVKHDIKRRHPNKRVEIPKEELQKLYKEEGLSTYEIAEVFDTTGSTIWRRMKEYGIERETKIEIPKEDLRKLYLKEEKTTYEVAEEYNVTNGTIHSRLKEYNIPRKNPNYYKKVKIPKEELKKLYNKEKLIIAEIAKKFEVSSCTIINRMEEYNMPRRIGGVRGKNHPFWKGGYEPYYGPDWPEQRRKALERDNHKCQWCGKGKEELGKEPSAHHIIRWKISKDNSLDNLITLCPHHHGWIERKTDTIIKKWGKTIIKK